MKSRSPEINFLRKQKHILVLQSKRLYLIQSLSFVTLFIYGVVLVGMLLYAGVLNVQLKQTEQRITKVKQELEDLAPIELKYYLLKKTTVAAMEISKSLQRHQELMQQVFNMIPSGMSVKSLKIEETGDINLNLLAENVAVIEAFFTNIERSHEWLVLNQESFQQGAVKVRKAEVKRVTVNDEGQYSFGIVVSIGLDAEKEESSTQQVTKKTTT